MSEAHFSKFDQVDAAESSILRELEDSTWGEVFNFQEILVLAKHMAAYRLPQGATLFKEGDRVPFLCLVYKVRSMSSKKATTGKKSGSSRFEKGERWAR